MPSSRSTATGDVALLRLLGADDAGTIVDPDIFEGQLHGGFAQGVAQALYEAIYYDEGGNLLTSSFADYAIVAATDAVVRVDRFANDDALQRARRERCGRVGHDRLDPGGAKRSGRCTEDPGIRHLDMPATPERVWRAIQAPRP